MATKERSRMFRMFPSRESAKFTTLRGAVIDATTNGYVDVVTQDADAMQSAGWTRLMEIGTTASRPVPGQSADIPGSITILSHGYAYYDTTLSQVVFWNHVKQSWVDQTNAAV